MEPSLTVQSRLDPGEPLAGAGLPLPRRQPPRGSRCPGLRSRIPAVPARCSPGWVFRIPPTLHQWTRPWLECPPCLDPVDRRCYKGRLDWLPHLPPHAGLGAGAERT